MPWKSNFLLSNEIHLARGPRLYELLTMWYSNFLIELFQTEFFSLSQRSDKYMDKFLLPQKFVQKLLTLANCNFSKLI